MNRNPNEPIGRTDDPSYRAIRFDAQGSVEATEIVAARTDDGALATVRAVVHRYGIDLWDRTRLVASFPALASDRSAREP